MSNNPQLDKLLAVPKIRKLMLDFKKSGTVISENAIFEIFQFSRPPIIASNIDNIVPLATSLGIDVVRKNGNFVSNGMKSVVVDSVVEDTCIDGFYLDSNAKLIEERFLAGDNILLVGPTGSGKSQLITIYANKHNRKLYRMNLHGQVDTGYFVGQWILHDGNTVWQDGILIHAMKNGGILLLDELDAAKPEILFVIQRVLEDGKLVLVENGAIEITAHEDFRIIGTANTLGKGDGAVKYSGTNVLNEAFLDRFECVFKLEYTKSERKIIDSYVNDKEASKQILQFFRDVRKVIDSEDLLFSMSTRKLKVFCEWYVKYGIYIALEHVVLGRLVPEDREAVEEISQRIFGDEIVDKKR